MKIVIKTTDGIQIMTLSGGADLDDALLKWKQAHVDKYISHRDIPDHAIPTDREFRDAWADSTPEKVIDFDMTKARAIHLERIRAKRNIALAVLDTSGTKAVDQENASLIAEVRAEKQVLRDIPQTISEALLAASTIAELKIINPL
jgi:hypothetical protein